MAEGEFPDLDLHRGHEVMLDIPDPDLSDPRLRLAGTAFVLVEWPGLQVPPSTLSGSRHGSWIPESGPSSPTPSATEGWTGTRFFQGSGGQRGALLQVNYGSSGDGTAICLEACHHLAGERDGWI